MKKFCLINWLLFLAGAGWAAENPARVPPPGLGLALAAADRAALEAGAAELGRDLASLRDALRGKPALLALLPDAQIFHKAVEWPLRYDEFYRSNDVGLAQSLLKLGAERARALRAGQAPWLAATGLVVRGYVSRIDDSVQPYGLVVPASFQPGAARRRLDVWLHGRDDKLTELKFLGDRLRAPGEFAPPDTFVLHPYGRFCNAFKFAGETDVFEALAHARGHYAIDGRRIAVRGFSMGGAGCWHLAAHHAGFWAAAAPGAGFAETADYTGALGREPKPAWFEQTLWHLYDATDWAGNLRQCPVLAYSGALDKQKQAADVMAAAMKTEGLELVHLIGPGTAHKYEPETKKELSRRFDALLAKGREPLPRKIHFTTWTLRYHEMAWLTVTGLGRHWARARVEAELTGDRRITILTTNVTGLKIVMPLDVCPWPSNAVPAITIDGQTVAATPKVVGGAWEIPFTRAGNFWFGKITVPDAKDTETRKRPGVQGPVDDAFMERFLIVRPTGEAAHAAVAQWTAAALARATNEWRAQFRGDARVKDDVAVTDADIAGSHLVLWGDPSGNRLLARLAEQLPLVWTTNTVQLAGQSFPAASHVPVLICANPLNPKRYVVLNSGFTFAAAGAGSNARQTPKLPDFAVLDLAASEAARVVHAGFFGEKWEALKR